jgi:integrase
MPWGAGSISGPDADGRYEVRISLGSVDGKRRRVRERVDSMPAARKKLTELQAKYGQTKGTPVSPKLAEYFEDWIAQRARVREAKTIRNYRYGMALVEPSLGHIRLDSLTHRQIIAALDRLRSDGKSESPVRVAYDTLRVVLNWAVKQDRILVASPIVGVTRPKEEREIDFLTADEARALLAAVADDRYRAVFHLAIATGLRLGEISGLHWREVNLDAGTMLVRQSLKDDRTFGRPKSKTSKRKIDVPATVIDELRAHRHRWRALEAKTNLVFCTDRGTALHASNFERRHFFPALERAGVRRVRFHDLRHTCATLLLGAGENPKVVSELLGHSSVRVTLDLYAHTMPGMGKAAAARMGDLLGVTREFVAQPKRVRGKNKPKNAA